MKLNREEMGKLEHVLNLNNFLIQLDKCDNGSLVVLEGSTPTSQIGFKFTPGLKEEFKRMVSEGLKQEMVKLSQLERELMEEMEEEEEVNIYPPIPDPIDDYNPYEDATDETI